MMQFECLSHLIVLKGILDGPFDLLRLQDVRPRTGAGTSGPCIAPRACAL
jgi:hypothetical protein